MKIKGKIHYVGVNDRNKNLFEGLWPLPDGVSYNSYLIDDDKVALVDTVEVDFFETFLKNIHDVIGDRTIDYLIINHMEPDHSGSISLIRKYYPDITIVGNKKTFGMIDGFYGSCEKTLK
jgi:flavorubredoxin